MFIKQFVCKLMKKKSLRAKKTLWAFSMGKLSELLFTFLLVHGLLGVTLGDGGLLDYSITIINNFVSDWSTRYTVFTYG